MGARQIRGAVAGSDRERQASTTQVDYRAGHGVTSTAEQRLEALVDEWSFIFWQTGDPDFQLRKPETAREDIH